MSYYCRFLRYVRKSMRNPYIYQIVTSVETPNVFATDRCHCFLMRGGG